MLMLTQLINRQTGSEGGDQHIRGKITSPRGTTEGKAQAEPDNPGWVMFLWLGILVFSVQRQIPARCLV